MISNALSNNVNQLNLKSKVHLVFLLIFWFPAVRVLVPFTLLELLTLHNLSRDSALLLLHLCLFER